MATLPELKLPSVMDTSSHDLSADFFEPLLSTAVFYDRGVGFFSSGWIRINARGMLAFARNGGRARWVTSPILDEADWEALQTGDAARSDPTLMRALTQSVGELEVALEKDALSALAWMVADGIITFKLAVPRNKLDRGDFHDKFGIFRDHAGNEVSFNGSYNDSIQGTRNYESIKVFRSWDIAFAPLVTSDADRFRQLWSNLDPNVRVFDLPEAARARILQLRIGQRPYPKPIWSGVQDSALGGYRTLPREPMVPGDIVLRDYQVQAINAWLDHQGQGLLEMATGTGKTITALAASARLYSQTRQLAVIIAAPYQHLVDQWNSIATAFGYQPILAYQNKTRWHDELNQQVMEYNARYRQFLCVITTHATFISPTFQASIERLQQPALFIGDEAHHLGAERGRVSYPGNILYRLALSATPDRWFDDAGTIALRNYFGETVFVLSLREAIGISLTPYYYHPHLVPLTDAELAKYEALSAKIARLMSREDEEGQEALKRLLILRADLLNTAENKIPALADLIDAQIDLHHALFYCAPKQIDEVTQLLGWEKGLIVHRFTAEEDARTRQKLLAAFDRKEYQGLVAMRCLDEGVDVPSTRTAFLLASSSNPREFIQRRGRVLRKAPGKEFAVIHDLIAVPPSAWNASRNEPTFAMERKIIRRELERFKEFADPAENKHEALDHQLQVKGIAALSRARCGPFW